MQNGFWRYLLIVFSFFLALTLQTTVMPLIQYKGAVPDLMLVYVVFTALFSNAAVGGSVGFIVGFMQDLVISRYLGLHAFSAFLTGYIVGELEDKFFKENPLVPMVIVFFSTYFYNFIYFIGRGLCGSLSLSFMQMAEITLIEAIFNIVLTFLLYYPLMWLFYKKPKFYDYPNSFYR
ncbi:MAG TPA: rod shape-determining protein MreD [Peptococcaceae bacterium]|nr:rod shape-determining protein MreD [Peptococcaceae bacterium]